MGYVYILISEKSGKYYIGSSKDYNSRLIQHNSGNVAFTKNLRPWKIVFYQKFDTIKQAKIIEYKLKKFKSRKILDKIIKDRIINIGPVAQR